MQREPSTFLDLSPSQRSTTTPLRERTQPRKKERVPPRPGQGPRSRTTCALRLLFQQCAPALPLPLAPSPSLSVEMSSEINYKLKFFNTNFKVNFFGDKILIFQIQFQTQQKPLLSTQLPPGISRPSFRGSARLWAHTSFKCCLLSLLKQVADLPDWADLPARASSMSCSASKLPLILTTSFEMRQLSFSCLPCC